MPYPNVLLCENGLQTSAGIGSSEADVQPGERGHAAEGYIQMPRCDNVRKGFIEHEAYTRLLAALPEYLRPVVTMAYCTGMRRGEIADATVAVLGLAGIETDQPIGDFRKVWDSACAKSGLTGRLFHDLRRSAVRALIRSGVQERVAMMILGHKTRSVFDRYNIVSEQDLTDAVRKLQRFQDAGQPAGQPAQAASSTPADRPAFVN